MDGLFDGTTLFSCLKCLILENYGGEEVWEAIISNIKNNNSTAKSLESVRGLGLNQGVSSSSSSSDRHRLPVLSAGALKPDDLFAAATYLSIKPEVLAERLGYYFLDYFSRFSSANAALLKCQGSTLSDWVSNICEALRDRYEPHFEDDDDDDGGIEEEDEGESYRERRRSNEQASSSSSLLYTMSLLPEEVYCILEDSSIIPSNDTAKEEEKADNTAPDLLVYHKSILPMTTTTVGGGTRDDGEIGHSNRRSTGTSRSSPNPTTTSTAESSENHFPLLLLLSESFFSGVIRRAAEKYFDCTASLQRIQTHGVNHSLYTIWRVATTTATAITAHSSGTAPPPPAAATTVFTCFMTAHSSSSLDRRRPHQPATATATATSPAGWILDDDYGNDYTNEEGGSGSGTASGASSAATDISAEAIAFARRGSEAVVGVAGAATVVVAGKGSAAAAAPLSLTSDTSSSSSSSSSAHTPVPATAAAVAVAAVTVTASSTSTATTSTTTTASTTPAAAAAVEQSIIDRTGVRARKIATLKEEDGGDGDGPYDDNQRAATTATAATSPTSVFTFIRGTDVGSDSVGSCGSWCRTPVENNKNDDNPTTVAAGRGRGGGGGTNAGASANATTAACGDEGDDNDVVYLVDEGEGEEEKHRGRRQNKRHHGTAVDPVQLRSETKQDGNIGEQTSLSAAAGIAAAAVEEKKPSAATKRTTTRTASNKSGTLANQYEPSSPAPLLLSATRGGEGALSSSASPSSSPSLQLQLNDIFPFHFAIDDSCIITHLGSSLRRHIPELKIGSSVQDWFRIKSPRSCNSSWGFTDLYVRKDTLFELDIIGVKGSGVGYSTEEGSGRPSPGAGFSLQGHVAFSPRSQTSYMSGTFAFLVEPNVHSISDMAKSGLTWSDFGKFSARKRTILLDEKLKDEEAVISEFQRDVGRVQQNLDMKSRFVRYMSHEIRTPLNTVSMGLDLVKNTLSKLNGAVTKLCFSRHRAASKLRGRHVSRDDENTYTDCKEGGDDDHNNIDGDGIGDVVKKLFDDGRDDGDSVGDDDTETCALTDECVDDLQSMVGEIKDSTEIAVNILNDLLLYEKLEGGILTLEKQQQPALLTVYDVVKTFRCQARQANLGLEFSFEDAVGSDGDDDNKYSPSSPFPLHQLSSTELSDPTVFINVDRNKLSQVIRNMVSNAIKVSSSTSTSCGGPSASLSHYATTATMKQQSADMVDEGEDKGEQEDSSNKNSVVVYCSVITTTTTSTTTSTTSQRGALKQQLKQQEDVEENDQAAAAITTSSAYSSSYLRVQVFDTGPGISIPNQEKLFGSIIQFDANKLQGGGGSGLGLYISKGIMDLHDGTIGVFSEGEEGQGSCFYIDIPITDTTSTAAPPIISMMSDRFLAPGKTLPTTLLAPCTTSGTATSSLSATVERVSSSDDRRRGSDAKDAAATTAAAGKTYVSSAVTATATATAGDLHYCSRNIAAPPLLSRAPSIRHKILLSEKKQKTRFTNPRNRIVGHPYRGTDDCGDDGEIRRHFPTGTTDTATAQPLLPVPVVAALQLPRASVAKLYSRLLIVDDSIANRKMLSKFLKASNICGVGDILEASDGREALEIVQQLQLQLLEMQQYNNADLSDEEDEEDQYHTTNQPKNPSTANLNINPAIDCILMDFIMPVMDGPTAAKQIRDLGYTGPIIGITGNVLPEDHAFFMDHGANTVMNKPLNLVKLHEVLTQYAGGGGSSIRGFGSSAVKFDHRPRLPSTVIVGGGAANRQSAEAKTRVPANSADAKSDQRPRTTAALAKKVSFSSSSVMVKQEEDEDELASTVLPEDQWFEFEDDEQEQAIVPAQDDVRRRDYQDSENVDSSSRDAGRVVRLLAGRQNDHTTTTTTNTVDRKLTIMVSAALTGEEPPLPVSVVRKRGGAGIKGVSFGSLEEDLVLGCADSSSSATFVPALHPSADLVPRGLQSEGEGGKRKSLSPRDRADEEGEFFVAQFDDTAPAPAPGGTSSTILATRHSVTDFVTTQRSQQQQLQLQQQGRGRRMSADQQPHRPRPLPPLPISSSGRKLSGAFDLLSGRRISVRDDHQGGGTNEFDPYASLLQEVYMDELARESSHRSISKRGSSRRVTPGIAAAANANSQQAGSGHSSNQSSVRSIDRTSSRRGVQHQQQQQQHHNSNLVGGPGAADGGAGGTSGHSSNHSSKDSSSRRAQPKTQQQRSAQEVPPRAIVPDPDDRSASTSRSLSRFLGRMLLCLVRPFLLIRPDSPPNSTSGARSPNHNQVAAASVAIHKSKRGAGKTGPRTPPTAAQNTRAGGNHNDNHMNRQGSSGRPSSLLESMLSVVALVPSRTPSRKMDPLPVPVTTNPNTRNNSERRTAITGGVADNSAYLPSRILRSMGSILGRSSRRLTVGAGAAEFAGPSGRAGFVEGMVRGERGEEKVASLDPLINLDDVPLSVVPSVASSLRHQQTNNNTSANARPLENNNRSAPRDWGDRVAEPIADTNSSNRRSSNDHGGSRFQTVTLDFNTTRRRSSGGQALHQQHQQQQQQQQQRTSNKNFGYHDYDHYDYDNDDNHNHYDDYHSAAGAVAPNSSRSRNVRDDDQKPVSTRQRGSIPQQQQPQQNQSAASAGGNMTTSGRGAGRSVRQVLIDRTTNSRAAAAATAAGYGASGANANANVKVALSDGISAAPRR